LGDQIKEDEMVEALACVRILVGTHEGKDTRWKNLGTGGKIILKQIFKKQDGREGVGFIRFTTSIKGKEFLD